MSRLKPSERAARDASAQRTQLSARVAEAPSDIDAILALARLHLRFGQPVAVRSRLKADAVRQSHDGQVHKAAFELLVDIGAFNDALRQTTFGEAVDSTLDWPAMARYAQARLDEDAAFGITPRLKLLYLTGMEALAARRPSDAVEALRQVTEAAPRFVPAWIALRGALQAQGSTEEAANLADQWRRQAPQDEAAIALTSARKLSPGGLLFDPRRPLPLRSVHELFTPVDDLAALAATPDSLLQLDPGGAPTTIDPVIPLADNDSDRVLLQFNTAEVFLAGLDNAAVLGRGVVVTAKGETPREVLAANLTKYAVYDDGDYAAFDAGLFQGGLGRVRVFDTEALLLVGATDKSYGDWMINFAPRLKIARDAGLRCPVVVSSDTPRRFIDILKAFGVTNREIIEHNRDSISLFRKLYVPSWPMREFLQPMKGLLDVHRGLMAAPKTGGRRLYLSRERINRRDMTNEAALRGLFERHGFEAVHPQELDLGQMRELLAEADYVAGPYGSAWLNLAYATRKPTAIVCMPPMLKRGFLHQIALWLGTMDLRFAYVTGELADADAANPKDAVWSTPLADVERVLERLGL